MSSITGNRPLEILLLSPLADVPKLEECKFNNVLRGGLASATYFAGAEGTSS